MNALSLDYAFGLIKELNDTHRVSLSFRWGAKPEAFTAIPENRPVTVYELEQGTILKPKEPATALSPVRPAIKPEQRIPVFQGPAPVAPDCSEESPESTVIFYGQGRTKCGNE